MKKTLIGLSALGLFLLPTKSNADVWIPTPTPVATVTPTPIPTQTPVPTRDMIVKEGFNSRPSRVSVNTLPGWTSFDASGNYDKDAIILHGTANEPAHSEPGYMRLVGYQANLPASATFRVDAPGKIKSLSLSFYYECQPGANPSVEIASCPLGPWTNTAIPLERDSNNRFDKYVKKDLTSLLSQAGIDSRAFIKWGNKVQGTNNVVFNVDDVCIELKYLEQRSAVNRSWTLYE